MATPQYIRTGDVLSNIIDSNTSEWQTYKKSNQWWDKTPMTDTKADGVNWRKLGDEYFKKTSFDTWGVTSVKDFGAVGDGVTDDYEAIQNCINKSNNTVILFPQGVYAFSQTITLPTNKQIVLRGEGRNSEHGPDFGIGDCIAKLKFIGTDPSVTAAIRSGTGQLNWEFQTIYLANASGRQDVDGIVLDRFVRGAMSNCVVFSFRNNIVINEDYFYTHFFKCRFGYPWQNNFLANSIANGATFYKCSFQGGGTDRPNSRGFYSTVRSGDLINFEQCEFESHSFEAIFISQIRVININGCYIEGNGRSTNTPSGTNTVNSQIYLGGYTNNFRTATILNCKGCHITMSQDVHFISAAPSGNVDNGNVKIILENNNFVLNNSWTRSIIEPSGAVTYAVVAVNNGSKLDVEFNYNGQSRHFITDPNICMGAVNIRPNDIGAFTSKNDEIVKLGYPDYQGYISEKQGNVDGLKTNALKCIPNAISVKRTNRDVSSVLDIDSPTVATANGGVNIGRLTNTTGQTRLNIYQGNGTETITSKIDGKTGLNWSKGFVIQDGPAQPNDTVGLGYFGGIGSPEGVVRAYQGSMYIDNNTGFWYKKNSSGSGNTGWVVNANRATALVDSASNVGVTYSQAEVQAILDELRQLKARMVAAGLASY